MKETENLENQGCRHRDDIRIDIKETVHRCIIDPFVLEYGPVAVCCEHGNGHSFVKFSQFLCSQLLASQEGLCFAGLNCIVYSQMPHSCVVEPRCCI
jgi:hypothetical protein